MESDSNFKVIEITSLEQELWLKTADYANHCSWQPTGSYLFNKMKNNDFLEWERVFTVLANNKIVGFCALTKDSAVFNTKYTPYLGFLFVDESSRGNNISRFICRSVIDYAKSIKLNRIFLYTDLVGFYEKLGFKKAGEEAAPWGVVQSIFTYDI